MQQAAPPAGFDFRALSAFAACPSTLPLRIGHITIRSSSKLSFERGNISGLVGFDGAATQALYFVGSLQHHFPGTVLNARATPIIDMIAKPLNDIPAHQDSPFEGKSPPLGIGGTPDRRPRR
jgi:hypothetical protein